MIASLRGTVSSINNTSIVLDVGGVGYLVEIPESSMSRILVGSELLLHTYLVVKEDAMDLYGFLEEKQRELFRLLLTVKGIGPKGAHKILSHIDVDEFVNLVLQGNASALCRVPGVGKKSADQIVLDLKKKIVILADQARVQAVAGAGEMLSAHKEAVSALMALGYRSMDAENAVRRALSAVEKDAPVEELVKKALMVM